MKIILCVDDNMGMLFNQRRQSRDVKVIEDIANITKELWIHSFSEKLFAEYAGELKVDDHFLKKAGKDTFCFVENQELMSYSNNIEQVILYCWNRKYPADFKLDLDLSVWATKEITEFAGNSHEKITKTILEPVKAI